MKQYKLSIQQTKVLKELIELETSSYGKSLCKEILHDGYYSGLYRSYLNIIRLMYMDQLVTLHPSKEDSKK